MIKKGYRLFATRVYGTEYVKQAKSARQFMLLCVKEEHAAGNYFNRRFNDMYLPDYVWSEDRHVWLNMSDGSVYGKTLPWRKCYNAT